MAAGANPFFYLMEKRKGNTPLVSSLTSKTQHGLTVALEVTACNGPLIYFLLSLLRPFLV